MAVLWISCLAVAGMIALVLVKPAVKIGKVSVSTFWLPPALAAVILLATGLLPIAEAGAGLFADSAVNPVKILILFFSMTLLSVFLDEAGFFRSLAAAVLRHSGTSQKKLFLLLYLAVSVLTVFTSNDIIVLTFTPFLCYFAKNAEIDPVPYLFCEFVAANTWSMALIIGNPTNIYLAAETDFAGYFRVMLLPTLFAGAASFLVLWLLFGKKLNTPMRGKPERLPPEDPVPVVLGLVALAGAIVLMALSSYLPLPDMWLVALVAFLGLYAVAAVVQLTRKKGLSLLGRSLRRAPFDVAPFVLSMFILVLALNRSGVVKQLAELLSRANPVFSFGIASFLACNLINNIPMSVLFSSVVSAAGGGESALFAAVIGSNIGAFLTPIGALAGIMWMGMLKTHGVRLSFGKFTAVGAAVAIPALFAALAGLLLAC